MLIDRNMKKKDLMAKTGITGTTIAKMGRGESVNLEVLGRICKSLNVNVGDIVDFVE
jgi:putative transcriptional regulator